MTRTRVPLLVLSAAFFACRSNPAGPDDALREELHRMVEVDQRARESLVASADPAPAAIEELVEIDRKNTARMKEIVAAHGWPGKSLVGEEGASNAWLLVQHADQDLEFQKRCLALLEEAVQEGEASPKELAYLIDRVLVAEGKKQLYGTQFTQIDGRLEPQPIEDEPNVDRRRAAVGLGTLSEYRKVLEEVYAR